MYKPGIRLAVAVALAAASSAGIVLSPIDVLDGVDPGAPSPAGTIVVDIGVDVTADDWFAVAAIAGRTYNGAALLYERSSDPNHPHEVVFSPPGVHNRFVSFGSAAYGRNDAPRFAPAGTVAEQTIAVLGAYTPPELNPRLRPDLIDVVYFAVPPAAGPNDPAAPRGRDGFVMRLCFDVTLVNVPGAGDPSAYRVFLPGDEPAGYLPVFISQADGFPHGTVVASQVEQQLTGRDWGLYVPEPLSHSIFLAGAFVLLRARAWVD